MFRPNSTAGYQGYQPDIKAFCIPDIMSCHIFGKCNLKNLEWLIEQNANVFACFQDAPLFYSNTKFSCVFALESRNVWNEILGERKQVAL